MEKSRKIILKMSAPEDSTRPKWGHRAARGALAPYWRGHPLGRAGGPAVVPHPLVPYLAPYFNLARKLRNIR